MVKFKTPDEIEARRAFIAGADKDGIIQQQDDIFSFSGLKKLSNEELIDRLEQVDNQATLIKWRILWALRQRFASDKLFGQYIAELKSTRAICAGRHQEINRALHAGRFCEKHRITNLGSVGLLQSAVYALSRPANEAIADEVYKQIKHKNIPVKDVERYIEQAKAVSTIDQPENLEPMPYEGGAGADVDPSYQARKTEPEIAQSAASLSVQIIEGSANRGDKASCVSPNANPLPEGAGAQYQFINNHQRRMAILETLPELVENEISDEEMLEELKAFCLQFKRPSLKIIPVIKLLMKQLAEDQYSNSKPT
jgi:hypothetical protein